MQTYETSQPRSQSPQDVAVALWTLAQRAMNRFNVELDKSDGKARVLQSGMELWVDVEGLAHCRMTLADLSEPSEAFLKAVREMEVAAEAMQNATWKPDPRAVAAQVTGSPV